MNKKLNMVLSGILFLSLVASTASATNLDDHKAGTGIMAPPTSPAGIASCGECHNIQLPAPNFCTRCHAFPTFTLSIAANPTTVKTATSTLVNFTVTREILNHTVSNATVTLSGAGVSASGTTGTSGIVTLTVDAANAGSITANATRAGFNGGTTEVTVVSDNNASVTITPVDQMITAGSSIQFSATSNIEGGATFTWSGSNPSAGTIDNNGLFTSTATNSGVTTITVNATGGNISVTNSTTLTVVAPGQLPVLANITVRPPNVNLTINDTQLFTASTFDMSGQPISVNVSWSSSNDTVGTIDSGGNFIARSAGTATIMAANGSTNGSANVTVYEQSVKEKCGKHRGHKHHKECKEQKQHKCKEQKKYREHKEHKEHNDRKEHDEDENEQEENNDD